MKANEKFTIKLEWLETSKPKTHLVAKIHLPEEIRLVGRKALEASTVFQINSKSHRVSVTYLRSLKECLEEKAAQKDNEETSKQKARTWWWTSKLTSWMQLTEQPKLWALEELTYVRLAKEARLSRELHRPLVVAVVDAVSKQLDKVLSWFSKSAETATESVKSSKALASHAEAAA
jgi:hypothetical protein